MDTNPTPPAPPLVWTDAPPTCDGWWWCWLVERDEPYIVEIAAGHAMRCGVLETRWAPALVAQWAGPILPPPG